MSRLLASLLFFLLTVGLQTLARHRVPLVKKKSLRRNLIQHGLLADFLKTHKLNPASKYLKEAASVLSTQPLENYLDVSAWAGNRGGSKDLARRRGRVPGVLENGPRLYAPRQ